MQRILVLIVLGCLPAAAVFSAAGFLEEARRLLATGEAGKAHVLLERAEREDPGDPQVLFLLGRARYALRRYPEALRAFDGALEADPAFARGYAMRGLVLVRLRRDRDAEGAFREALLLEPGDAFTAGQLADLLVRAAREREARPLAELAVRVRPDAWAHQRLARIAERLGDRQAAATHYRHALAAERDPKRREGLQRRLGADRYRQAVAAKRAGRLEEALTAFRMIAAAEPSSRYGKAAQAQSTALERLLAKGKK